MKPITILCIEDEPEVLEVVLRDLKPFEQVFVLESAASVDEARRVLREVILPTGELGLAVCDHILPGEDGVSFLVELQQDPVTAKARKILLTAHAGLQATVEAVNRAGLNHYIAKPWKAEELVNVARKQLTDYVIETQTDLVRFLSVLDAERIGQQMRERPLPGDE
jgi:response regulator RpfG family c-di-GMP phosphodiesterase